MFKAIMRSLVKNLSRFGLVLYIYSGEYLLEIEVEKITTKDTNILKNVVKSLDEPDEIYALLLKRYNIKSFRDLTKKQRVEILAGLNQLASEKKIDSECDVKISNEK